MKYVIHFCHNKKCNNSWIDKDLTNVKSRPPSWKYCPECETKGFVNPERPPLLKTQKTKIEKMHQARTKKQDKK